MKEKILLTNEKYLWLLLNTSWGLVFCVNAHLCTISKGTDISKEKEKSLSNREYISGHGWERINMVAKYIVHMHITTELKSYWLLFDKHSQCGCLDHYNRVSLNILMVFEGVVYLVFRARWPQVVSLIMKVEVFVVSVGPLCGLILLLIFVVYCTVCGTPYSCKYVSFQHVDSEGVFSGLLWCLKLCHSTHRDIQVTLHGLNYSSSFVPFF